MNFSLTLASGTLSVRDLVKSALSEAKIDIDSHLIKKLTKLGLSYKLN